MKRLLVLLLVFGLALAIAAPAGAKKPDCETTRTHPSCEPTEPARGSSCVSALADKGWSPDEVKDAGAEDFEIVLDGKSDRYCVDVGVAAGDVPPGTWNINVTVTDGSVRRLLIVLRDSVAPGDACDVVELTRLTPDPTTPYGTEVTSMESSGVDACGTEFGDDPYDAVPFSFLVFMWAHGNDDPTVTVNVDVPIDN